MTTMTEPLPRPADPGPADGPRDRHEAHAAPPPPWNLEVRMYRGDVLAEGPNVVALKPDDPIRKVFEARPEMTQLSLTYADGATFRYTKTYPSGPPKYGMKTDEGDTAVDLAVRAAVNALYGQGIVNASIDITTAVVYAILGFADANDVDMSEVESAGTKGLIRMRARDYMNDLDEDHS